MAEKRSEPASCPKLPDNWTPDGVSKGKQTGPVRPSPDAHNERKGKR